MTNERADTADSELVTSAAAGDPAAFAALYDRYAPRIYSRFLCELRDAAEAKDATQETFIDAWRGLPNLRDPQAFPAWLGTIASRRTIKAGRPGGAVAQDDELLADLADPGPGPEDVALQAQAGQLVSDAVPSLTPRYQEAIRHLMAYGQAGSGLGAQLGISSQQASRLADKATHSLANAVSALVVAQTGRQACAGLDRILSTAGWSAGPLSEELRDKVQRHIGRCDRCEPQRRAAGRKVMQSLPVVVPFIVPADLRARTLEGAQNIAATPPQGLRSGRLGQALAVGGAAALVASAAVVLSNRGSDDDGTTGGTDGDATNAAEMPSFPGSPDAWVIAWDWNQEVGSAPEDDGLVYVSYVPETGETQASAYFPDPVVNPDASPNYDEDAALTTSVDYRWSILTTEPSDNEQETGIVQVYSLPDGAPREVDLRAITRDISFEPMRMSFAADDPNVLHVLASDGTVWAIDIADETASPTSTTATLTGDDPGDSWTFTPDGSGELFKPYDADGNWLDRPPHFSGAEELSSDEEDELPELPDHPEMVIRTADDTVWAFVPEERSEAEQVLRAYRLPADAGAGWERMEASTPIPGPPPGPDGLYVNIAFARPPQG